MRNKILILITIMAAILAGFLFKAETRNQKMISPQASITPTPTPIEYHLDKNSDLKKELESVSPSVSDQEFSQINRQLEEVK